MCQWLIRILKHYWGTDYFIPKHLKIDNDTIQSTIKGSQRNDFPTWAKHLSGMEIFFLTKLFEENLDFAEENFTHMDSMYVLQAILNGEVYKFFLSKTDYLIQKVTVRIPVAKRQGGGLLTTENTYDDYRSLGGVMVSHRVSGFNNMSRAPVVNATLTPSGGTATDRQ